MVFYISSSDSNNSIKNSTFNVITLSGTALKQSHRSIPVYSEDRSNIDEFYTPAEETESESNIRKKHAHRRRQSSLKTDESQYTYSIETKKCFNSNVYDVFVNSLLKNNLLESIRNHNSHVRKEPLHTEKNMRNLEKQIEFSIDKPKKTREMKNIENKCDRAEKATYCRPVTEYNNEEYLYKTLADKRRLQELVKKMIKARAKEKQKAAWDDYIHQLRIKHTKKDEFQPTTSKALHPPDTGIDMDILEDCYNTRFRTAPSNHCKTLLRDLYSSSIDTDRFPIRSYANANLFSKNSQNDYTNIKNIPNGNQCEFTPGRNGAIENNPSSSTNNFNPYLQSTSQNPYITYPCSSSGRLIKLNKLAALDSCDLGIRKRRLSRYNNKTYQKSNLESRNNSINKTKLISKSYGNRSLSSKSRNNDETHIKFKRGRSESSQERNREHKNKMTKIKNISPRQQNSSRTDDVVVIFTEGKSDISQDRNREHENKHISENKYLSPRQQNSTRTDVQVFTEGKSDISQDRNREHENKQTSKNKKLSPRKKNSTRTDQLAKVFAEGKSEISQDRNREHENKQTLKNKNLSTKWQNSTRTDDSFEVSRQNKLNIEREKETNLNRNKGVNTIAKKLKSNGADGSIVSSKVTKSSHERETKITPSLDQNSLKNIEDKLDILITQMNSLLGKSELLNIHQCPCKIKNLDQYATNKPINNEETCCRTRMLQIFKSEESEALNNKNGYNNRNDVSSYIEQRDTFKITEETTNVSEELGTEEYTAPQKYSQNSDISDGNKNTVTNNSNKSDTPNIEITVNETKNGSQKNNNVYNEDEKFIFVTISNKSTSMFEGSRASINVPKIDEILLEEMNKSDKVKRDIEGILNGNASNPWNLHNIFEEPTRDCGTEVTKSLSKAKIEDDSSIESTEVVTIYDNNPNERLAMAVNTDPLGLLSLLKISTATIGRLLNFVNFSYQSLLPLPMPRPLNRPPMIVFNCTMCNSSFQKSSEFSEHIITHEAQPSKDCCVCRHMLEKSGRIYRPLFSCRYCNKNFTRAYCCELHEQHCSRRLGKKHDVPENLAILS